MYKLAVCDNVPETARVLAEIIKKDINMLQLKEEISDIVIYNTAEETIKRAEEYDILFLEIEMPDMDGIEAGKIIRKINPDIMIIAMSEKTGRFKEVFEINALRFVTKPYDGQEVENALMSIEEKISGLKTIKVFKNKRSIEIMQRDILYIEAYEGAVRIHTISGEYRLDISLNNIMKQLDSRFFARIHRSYIVNMKWIVKYDNGVMKIKNCTFKVSRNKRKEFENTWSGFIFQPKVNQP